jgi:hypothetical protein
VGGLPNVENPKIPLGRPALGELPEIVAAPGARIRPTLPEAVLPPPAGAEPQSVLERVAGRLEEVQQLGTHGEWGRLSGPAGEVLRTPGLPQGLRQPMAELQRTARQLELLTRLQAALESPRALDLAGVDPSSLPEPVQNVLRGLRGVEDLRAALAQPWRQAPDVNALNRDLADVFAVTENGPQVSRWREALAQRATQARHAEAATRLRDLKAAACPGVPGGEAGGTDAPRPGPGLQQPESPAAGVRAPVRGSVGEGLEEDVAGTAKRLRTQAREKVSEQAAAGREQAQSYLHSIHHFSEAARRHSRQEDSKSDKDGPEAQVARALGRPLTAGERILVGRLCAQGRTPAEVAGILRGLDRSAARK